MKDQDPNKKSEQAEPNELAALDAFEQAWVGKLAEPELDLADSEDAFVNAVMAKHLDAEQDADPDAEQHAEQAEQSQPSKPQPEIAGRVGIHPLTFSAAAAILVATFVGGYVLINSGMMDKAMVDKQPAANPFASKNMPNLPLQPKKTRPVTPPVAKQPLAARAHGGITSGVVSVTTAIQDLPGLLPIDDVLGIFGNPVPDLKGILTPVAPKPAPETTTTS